MKVDLQVARCLYRLQATEFKPLVDYLTTLRSESVSKLTDLLDDTQLRREQGRASMLSELLDGIAKSQDTIRKLGG